MVKVRSINIRKPADLTDLKFVIKQGYFHSKRKRMYNNQPGKIVIQP